MSRDLVVLMFCILVQGLHEVIYNFNLFICCRETCFNVVTVTRINAGRNDADDIPTLHIARAPKMHNAKFWDFFGFNYILLTEVIVMRDLGVTWLLIVMGGDSRLWSSGQSQPGIYVTDVWFS
jgi:hypothetical protein